MGRGRESERLERHYQNADYEDAPNAAPFALRAVRASVTRRAKAIRTRADTTLATIDRVLVNEGQSFKASTPPADSPERHRPESEDTLSLPTLHRKLGAVAVLVAQGESIDLPPDTRAA